MSPTSRLHASDTGTVEINGEPAGGLSHGPDPWHRHRLALSDDPVGFDDAGDPIYDATSVAHAHPGGDVDHDHDDLALGEAGEVKGPDPDEWGERPEVGADGLPVVEPDYEVKGPDPDKWPAS